VGGAAAPAAARESRVASHDGGPLAAAVGSQKDAVGMLRAHFDVHVANTTSNTLHLIILRMFHVGFKHF
jgi:hypothetical protein